MTDPAIAQQLALAHDQANAAWVEAGAACIQALGAVAAIVVSIVLATQGARRESAARKTSAAREEAAAAAAERRARQADEAAERRALRADEAAARRVREADEAAALRDSQAQDALILEALDIVDPVIAAFERQRDGFAAQTSKMFQSLGSGGKERALADLTQMMPAAASHPTLAIALNKLCETLRPHEAMPSNVPSDLSDRAERVRAEIATARERLTFLLSAHAEGQPHP